MNSRPTYKRMGIPFRAPVARSAFDEEADSLFTTKLIPPIPLESLTGDLFDGPESSSYRPPAQRKRERHPVNRKPPLLQEEDDDEQQEDESLHEDDRNLRTGSNIVDDDTASRTTQTSKSSRATKKKKAAAGTHGMLSGSVDDVRLGKRRRLKNAAAQPYDPTKDPQIIAFEKEMEDLKNHPLNIMDEVDYWREVEEVQHREDRSRISPQALVGDTTRKKVQENDKTETVEVTTRFLRQLFLTKKERDQLKKDTESRQSMVREPAPINLNEEWETDTAGPQTSTPIVLSKQKSIRPPKLSAIKGLSPLSTIKKHSVRFADPNDVLPGGTDTVRKSRVEKERASNKNFERKNDESVVDANRNRLSSKIKSTVVEENGDDDLASPEREMQTAIKVRPSKSDTQNQPSTSKSPFATPVQTPKLRKRTRPSNTRNPPLLQSLLKKRMPQPVAAGDDDILQPKTTDPWTSNLNSSPANLNPPKKIGNNSTVNTTSSSSHRRHRESIGVFSPAVFSEEDRISTSQIRAHRKSVVVNARKSPFDLILDVCSPTKVIHTDRILDKQCRDLIKLGEGSYADVYRVIRNGEEIVLKIIPVNSAYTNGERQTTYEEILSEMLISRELTTALLDEKNERFFAPVFARTFFTKIAEGAYPDDFSHQADKYARENEGNALNQHPTAYEDDQQFVIIGLANGGEALDTYPLMHFAEAKSVFQQIALGLAIAEKKLEFEHRDLHISNILVRKSEEEFVRFICDGIVYLIPSCGLHVTVIDWTLSRMRKGKQIVYKDLKEDEALFNGSGDEQFDVYRLMRDANENDWQEFVPKTNVFWLRYLQQKLLKEKNVLEDKDDLSSKKDLAGLSRGFKNFASAADLVARTKWFQTCISKAH